MSGVAHRKPNVLFIICDDLNDSVEGMGGIECAKTPNIRRLASDGRLFLNAHCNDPICAPSRASLWSGLHPHSTGYYTLSDHWQSNPVLNGAEMMMERFRSSGYHVYGTGKLFHNSHEVMSFYDQFGYEPSFGPFPWDGNDPEKPCVHPSLSFMIDSNPRIAWQWEQTFGPLSNTPSFDARSGARGARGYDGWRLYNKPFYYRSDESRDLMPDELSVRWASRILERDHKDPFFLAVGFARPHTPLYAPDRYFEKFPLDSICVPPYDPEEFERLPPAARDTHIYSRERFVLLMESGGEELWRRWIQAYLACVSFVDDQVGFLIDALKASKYADDTVVVFTSDNGYHMGEKGMLHKHTLWEESTRIPLVISLPEDSYTGVSTNTPVSLLDVYPTLVDACGLSTGKRESTNVGLDGGSLYPLLTSGASGEEIDDDRAALTVRIARELPEMSDRLCSEPGIVGEHRSIRTRNWRYTRYANGDEELFDHLVDPNEWTNLASAVPHHAEDLENLRRKLNSRILVLDKARRGGGGVEA